MVRCSDCHRTGDEVAGAVGQRHHTREGWHNAKSTCCLVCYDPIVMSKIDFGRHSQDYAACRPGFPPSFYRRIDAIIHIREWRLRPSVVSVDRSGQ